MLYRPPRVVFVRTATVRATSNSDCVAPDFASSVKLWVIVTPAIVCAGQLKLCVDTAYAQLAGTSAGTCGSKGLDHDIAKRDFVVSSSCMTCCRSAREPGPNDSSALHAPARSSAASSETSTGERTYGDLECSGGGTTAAPILATRLPTGKLPESVVRQRSSTERPH